MADTFARPSGRLLLTARREGETARLETAYALAGDRLRLSDAKLTAPEAAFAGEADIDTASASEQEKKAPSTPGV